MMFAKVVTVAFEGVEARRVDVEVTSTHGQQGSFQVVGLGDKAVAESRERVRGALAGIGLAFPAKRVVANLAPADLPKEGSHFDLPIALALLASMGVLPVDALDGWMVVGELGLDGRIAPVAGALPAAVAASTTRGNGAVSAYGWDGASRLTSLSIDLASTGQDATWTLDYNPAGQVIERTLSNTAYAYTAAASLSDAYTNDGLNRVTAVDLTSVTYDGRFNITGDGTSTWSYDASNRLTGSGTASFTFDPANRLYSSTLSSTTNRFQYAGSQIIATYDGTGTLIERYVPGAGLDDYAAWTAGTGGGIMRQWPVTDPLGSVVGLTNGSNVATQINSYDEYGIPASGNAGRFGYAGSMFLPQAGVAPWHMRNRQYHPELGRFLQTDPIGIAGGVNLYAFVGGDPVNWVDPWGLQQGQPEPHDCRGPVAPLGCFPEDNVDEVVVVGNCNIWCQIRRFFGRLGRGDRGDDPALPDLGVPTEYCPLDERLNLFDPEEDPEMYDRGNLATNPVPGSFMVTGHGNPSGVYGPGGRVTGSQLAGMIQRQPGYSPGQTIVIASCRVGQGSTPQIVANSTGSCVVAPTGYAWFGASGGAPYSAFDTPERGPEGQRRPGRPAGWRTVCPE